MHFSTALAATGVTFDFLEGPNAIYILIALIAIAGYLLGSLPAGYLIARAKGIDIRKHGSGNIGATNVFRTLGKPWGILVFVIDALKGVLAVCLAAKYVYYHPVVWSHVVTTEPGIVTSVTKPFPPAAAAIIGGIAAIIGHNFPVWLKFKGGKGVATSLGVLAGLAPLAALIAFIVWALVFFGTGYVSLASIVAALIVPVAANFTASPDEKTPLICFTSVAALLIVLRHRPNIRRLLNGTENRFRKNKATSAETKPESKQP